MKVFKTCLILGAVASAAATEGRAGSGFWAPAIIGTLILLVIEGCDIT